MNWFVQLLGTVARGSNLLMAGDPGAGKSTIALQLALAAACAGERTMIISTEQSRQAINARLTQLGCSISAKKRRDIMGRVSVIDDLADLAALPTYIARQILGLSAPHYGTALLVADSVHGQGNPAGDRKFYAAIYESMRLVNATGIVALFLAHFTKGKHIAGPRALEHQADVSLILRHSIACRALTVPKNRNGASHPEPYSLEIDEHTTRLVPSRLATAASAKVSTVAAGGCMELEVAVTLPRTERGHIKAPGLAIREIETIVDLVSRLTPAGRALPNLGVVVRGPAGARYQRDHSLPVAVGLLAALRREQVEPNMIVIGDLDLRGNILPPAPGTVQSLINAVHAGALSSDAFVVCAPGQHTLELRELGLSVQEVTIVTSAQSVGAR